MRDLLLRALFLIGAVCLPTVAHAQSEAVEYYHTDVVGTVRLITNASGQVLETFDYLPFGEAWPGEVTSSNPRRFIGKERDAETGLDYFGARYYSNRSARFTSVDPVLDIDQALVDPQRWNRYAYALNNPLRNIDPDGRQVLDANLQKMLELLKTPTTLSGAVRGPLIQTLGERTLGRVLGEIFGYRRASRAAGYQWMSIDN